MAITENTVYIREEQIKLLEVYEKTGKWSYLNEVDGFEKTGEFRPPAEGEWYLWGILQ